MSIILDRYDPTKELEESLDEKIHIYNMQTHGRKSITVVIGLILSKENEQLFLTKAKDKFSTAGYKKIIPVYDQKREAFCFNGDKRLESKELIMKLFDKANDVFIIH